MMNLEYLRSVVLSAVLLAATFALPSSGVITPEEFNADSPMEAQTTQEEVAKLLAEHAGRDYMLFPEDRLRPIRMLEALPRRWIESGPGSSFRGQAQPGEFYVFQIGLFAARKDIIDVGIEYSDLKGPLGKTISSSLFRCINLGGIDWKGQRFIRQVNVTKGHVQPLWIGIPIPKQAFGRYDGELTVRPGNSKPTRVKLIVEVAGEALDDHGDSQLWRHSRLRWLDSTVGLSAGHATVFLLSNSNPIYLSVMASCYERYCGLSKTTARCSEPGRLRLYSFFLKEGESRYESSNQSP